MLSATDTACARRPAAEDRPLQVGIIGCGKVATAHAPAYRALPHVTVAAVSDLDPHLATTFADHWAPTATVYQTPAEMLTHPGLDAVSVCTPNAGHHSVTLQALRAGLHVLCEKPPALNARQAREMAETADQAGRVLTYGLVYRHMLRALDASLEQIGTVYRAHASWCRPRGYPNWGSHGSHAATGGGVLLDLGAHIVDLAWHLMGRPGPAHASARTYRHKIGHTRIGLPGHRDPSAFDVEDHAIGHVDFRSGARLTVEVAYAVDTCRPIQPTITLQGVRGGLEVKLMTFQQDPDRECVPVVTTEQDGRLVELRAEPRTPMTIQQGYAEQAAHFVSACRRHQKPLVTARQGVVLQAMLDALYTSAAKSGRSVTIAPD